MTSDAVSAMAFRRLLARTIVLPPILLTALSAVFLGQIMYLLSSAEWVDHTDHVIANANALLKLFVDGETGMRGYLVTGQPVFLEPYHVEENSVGPAFEGMMELVSDSPAQVERLQGLRTDHAHWQDYARTMIDLRREGGEYQSPLRNGEGKRRMDALRAQIADFIRVEEELRDVRTRRVQQATWVVVAVSLGLALLLGGVLSFFTRRQILLMSASYLKALSDVQAQAESLRKSAHRLQTLHDIDRAILAADSVPEMARSSLRRMEQIVPGGEALVLVFDPDGGPAHVLSRSAVGTTLGGDDAALALEGVGSTEFSEEDGLHAITDLADVPVRSLIEDRLFRTGHRSCLAVPLQADGRRFGVLILADARPSAFTAEHQQIADEVARQLAIAFQHARLREQLRRHADDLEKRVADRTRELQEALDSVKQLHGLLPICAWCKKVRDDRDYWHEVENYVAANTEAQFTHSICPACLERNLKKLQGVPSKA
jgi:CHASE3 domain sensor protein